MKYLSIIITVFAITFSSFAEDQKKSQSTEIFIVATVNQTPITNIDLYNRGEILKIFMPEFEKLSQEQQITFSMQNLIQELLKKDYIKRMNIKISDAEVKQETQKFIEILKQFKVEDFNNFVKKNQDFVRSEIIWNIVVEKQIKPNISINEETILAIQKEQPKMTKNQIIEAITMQQIEMQTNQILESLKKISVIDIVQ